DRGERLPVELVVSKMTRDTARLYGFGDRGVVAPGYRADLNVVDFDNLNLRLPELVFDLPGGARRLIQKADGYAATVVAGEITFEETREAERPLGTTITSVARNREPVTVPASRYIAPEFAALEQARLWPRVWQLACTVDHVAHPGDFFDYSFGPYSILLVRGD